MAKRAWLKVETLGDRVFCVNYRHFGASLSAQEVGLQGNCIYFLRGDDKGLYVYNMERGTTTLHNPGHDLQDDVAPEMLMPAS
uniref:KIB1-4 beta-propeller domain-containing protein n=1 Tax=Triticum urartu TaxID=4572 RepID=A0A8R7UTN7_TRIUA